MSAWSFTRAAYGFSRLRTYTHVALVWIGLLLATVVVLEILHRERGFALAALVASLGFAVSLAVLNVDGLIVKENVYRAEQGEGFDVPYLVSLSTDSVPALVDVFRVGIVSRASRVTQSARSCSVVCYSGGEIENSDWRSFTLSRWQADAAFKLLQRAVEPISRGRCSMANTDHYARQRRIHLPWKWARLG